MTLTVQSWGGGDGAPTASKLWGQVVGALPPPPAPTSLSVLVFYLLLEYWSFPWMISHLSYSHVHNYSYLDGDMICSYNNFSLLCDACVISIHLFLFQCW